MPIAIPLIALLLAAAAGAAIITTTHTDAVRRYADDPPGWDVMEFDGWLYVVWENLRPAPIDDLSTAVKLHRAVNLDSALKWASQIAPAQVYYWAPETPGAVPPGWVLYAGQRLSSLHDTLAWLA